MKLYFGNWVTTATTAMLIGMLGFLVYSIINRQQIHFWGRRMLFISMYGLLICCFGAAIIIVTGLIALFCKSQSIRQILFYLMSSGIIMKIITVEIGRIVL